MCKTIPSMCSSSVSLAPLPWDVASLEAWQRWGERRGRAVGANPPQTLTMMRAFSYCPVELYYIIPCWWCPWKKAVRGRHRCLQEGLGAAWCYGGAVHLRIPIIYINYIYILLYRTLPALRCLPPASSVVLPIARHATLLKFWPRGGGRWEVGGEGGGNQVGCKRHFAPSPPLPSSPLPLHHN